MTDKKTTHFGYQEIPTAEKTKKVSEVFHSVASKYDLMNDVLSLGAHRYWKHFAIAKSHVRPGQQVLDVASGTGDLAYLFAKKIGADGLVVLSDINSSMLKIGRDRMLDKGLTKQLQFVQADAEQLPFPDNSFDCVTMSFGLRNCTDKDAVLRSILRVLKPGGQLLVLEFSKPTLPWLAKIYDTYSFSIMPKLGEWIAKDRESYQYLAESIRMHPDQETLLKMFETAGFQKASYHNLSGGIVALHQGYKL